MVLVAIIWLFWFYYNEPFDNRTQYCPWLTKIIVILFCVHNIEVTTWLIKVKLSLCLHLNISHEVAWRANISLCLSSLGRTYSYADERPGSRFVHYTPVKDTHWIGHWIGFRTGLKTTAQIHDLARNRFPVVQLVASQEFDLLSRIIDRERQL